MRSLSRDRRRAVVLAASATAALAVAPLAVIASPAHAAEIEVTVLGTNDFHGRLLPDRDIPGAAKYAGAVEQLRTENPYTVFAAAGDLIGATTFESFINDDKPTIDVLNEMDLDVSAVGNHELDQGWDDLVHRVMAPYDPDTNPTGGAEWEYIVANLTGPQGEEDLIEDSWTTDVGGVTVGFVGAVTEDLPSLVSPSGIEGVEVHDVVAATNAEADRLKAEAGADVVVLLVHEGAPTTDCATMADNPASTFGSIVNGVNANVDAIVSGHTHLAYNCSLPVAEWAGRAVTERPVVSAGQYGAYLNKLDFTVDTATGGITGLSQSLLNVNTTAYPTDPEVKAIVDQAVADAEGPGSVPLGEIAGPFRRAERPAPTTENPDAVAENRGGESTLGNQVAEVQRWATGSQLAFMNPGGLRADMIGNAANGYPAQLTYKQAAVVQPFANTLVSMSMTGAQVRALLEQQWQPGQSRPFLKLGVSDGFEYTYDPTAAQGERIDRMWLDGEEIRADRTYTVTANSFLASGGDNFGVFTQATGKRDTGQVDLAAMVDYLEAFASDQPLAPDLAQRAVGVAVSDAGPKVGVRLDLTSLAMTAPGDPQDDRVLVMLGDRTVASAEVDNTRTVAPFDESGSASVALRLPPGRHTLRVVGPTTGTDVPVVVDVPRAGRR